MLFLKERYVIYERNVWTIKVKFPYYYIMNQRKNSKKVVDKTKKFV